MLVGVGTAKGDDVDNVNKREALEQLVSERRRKLGGRTSLDPRVRALSQSGSRHLLPPRGQTKHSTISLMLLSALAVLALVICTATATAVILGGTWLQGALSNPDTAIEGFYGALEQRDYASAYGYFSASARAHLSESAFADQFSGYDAIDGAVSNFSVGAIKQMANGTAATVAVTVTRQGLGSTAQVHSLELVKENGSWRISNITIQPQKPTPASK